MDGIEHAETVDDFADVFAANQRAVYRLAFVLCGDASLAEDAVGFYRWHLSDPVVFQRDLKVTVQQIGFRWKGGYYDRKDDWCATASRTVRTYSRSGG